MSTRQTHPGTRPVDDELVRRLVAAGLPVRRVPSGGTVNAMYGWATAWSYAFR